MSLRTGGREAVEDTPVTGATEEQVRPENLLALNMAVQMAVEIDAYSAASGETEAGNIADVIRADLRRSGYVIVRAEDALTAEQRAAIGFVIRCLKEVCCDVESPHYLNEEGAEIARRVEAIAAGGQA